MSPSRIMGRRSYHARATLELRRKNVVSWVARSRARERYSQTAVARGNVVAGQTLALEHPQRPLTHSSVPDAVEQSVLRAHSHWCVVVLQRDTPMAVH